MTEVRINYVSYCAREFMYLERMQERHDEKEDKLKVLTSQLTDEEFQKYVEMTEEMRKKKEAIE